MNVKVRLFAVAKDLAGSETIEVNAPAACTVNDLRRAMCNQFPRLKEFGAQLRFAVNADYADDNTPIDETSEVACIPPVSGG